MANHKEQVNEALGLMQEARKILFQVLHENQSITQNLAEGVDKLALAFEFVENPEGLISLCPSCECLFYETVSEGYYRCLSCDEEYTPPSMEDRDGWH